MRIHIALPAALLAALTASAALADEKWEITTTVQMTGMPFQPPPTTVSVCVPPGSMSGEKAVTQQQQDKNCKMTSLKTVGSTTSFTMQCTGAQQLTAEGQVTHQGSSYSGTMKARGNSGGHAFDMQTSYSGKKVGPCDGKETVNAQKIKQAQDAAAAGQAAQAARQAGAPPAGQQVDPAKIMEQMQKMKQMYGQ